jgi:chemotaxis signal transduction protein
MSLSSIANPDLRIGSPQTGQPQALTKLISFRLQSPHDASRTLNFGVAISQVQRILNKTTVYGSGTTASGLVDMADHQITLIDLGKLVFGQPIDQTGYLVVLKATNGGSFGIPVPQSPSLVEIAADQLKPLPVDYRAMDTLGIASHVGKAQGDDGEQVVFLLDLDRVISHLSGAISGV